MRIRIQLITLMLIRILPFDLMRIPGYGSTTLVRDLVLDLLPYWEFLNPVEITKTIKSDGKNCLQLINLYKLTTRSVPNLRFRKSLKSRYGSSCVSKILAGPKPQSKTITKFSDESASERQQFINQRFFYQRSGHMDNILIFMKTRIWTKSRMLAS